MIAYFRKLKNLDTTYLINQFKLYIDKSQSKEWIANLLIEEDLITLEYFREVRSLELFYDSSEHEENLEVCKRVYKANCIIFKKRKRILIYGNSVACSNCVYFFEKKLNIQLHTYSIPFNKLLKTLKTKDYEIKNIEYKEVEFLNTLLDNLSLEFKSNNDAQKILKQINVNPTKLRMKLHNLTQIYFLSINLSESFIELQYDSLNALVIEHVKELFLMIAEEDF